MARSLWKRQGLMSAMEQNKMIWIYREDRLCEAPFLLDALGLMPLGDSGRQEASSGGPMGFPVVSAVGAGGKTTTLRRLAEEFVQQGQRAVVTTTTHIVEENKPYFYRGTPDAGFPAGLSRMREAARTFLCEIRKNLDRFGQVWTGMPASGGKLGSLPEAFVEQLWTLGVPVLIEADGARKMPLKVPAGHEPVLHPRTTHVLSVYGLDAVGERLEDVCFRKELAEKLLRKNGTERVTAGDIALFAASPRAGRKGCPEGAAYTVVLNKADNTRRKEDALAICRELKKRGIPRVVVTSYPDSREKDNREKKA